MLRKPTRRALIGSGAASLLAVLLVTATYALGLWGGNVRTVIPGRFYRSAQLSGDQLHDLISREKIRTVVNLRGGKDHYDWLQDERSACAANGADYRQITLSASTLPRPRVLRQLLEILDEAEYPVLIHCRHGADRTGLAATLYMHLYQGMPLDQAEAAQLTWRFGHVAWLAPSMGEFFDLYRGEARGKDLRTWILTDYSRIYARETGRPQRGEQARGRSARPHL